jgi:hypothetical protein
MRTSWWWSVVLFACDGEVMGADRDGGSRADDGGAVDAARSDGAIEPGRDAGDRPDASFVRGVTNPEILFEGTEMDLGRHYGLYLQDDTSSIELADDPTGAARRVIRFRKTKSEEWTHVMVRPADMRTDYREAAQVTEYEVAYHYRQSVYVTGDPQYSDVSFNLIEDFHCEPCEANNLQIMLNMDGDGSLCLWIAYSTDPEFDPRGYNRGGSSDPWDVISPNRTVAGVRPDGYADIEGELPPTGSLVICRDDLPTERIFDRWVELEIIMRPSSYETGVVMMWLDGHPYFYDGPNIYRWNQDSSDSLPVNTFQIGLYGSAVEPAPDTDPFFEMFATPPRIELGDGILGR